MSPRALAISTVAIASLASIAACTSSDGSSSGTSGTSGASGSSGSSCPEDLPAACPSPPPSYAKDVAPVFQAACTPCHAAGGKESNRLLTNYDAVNRQRGAVLNQVHACNMPPADGPPLTAQGRAVMQAWLVCGAPNN